MWRKAAAFKGGTSRVTGDCHARFCERLGVKFPGPTRQRWQTMGLVGGMVVILVAHTFLEQDGEEVIRIISARKATPHERRIYEERS